MSASLTEVKLAQIKENHSSKSNKVRAEVQLYLCPMWFREMGYSPDVWQVPQPRPTLKYNELVRNFNGTQASDLDLPMLLAHRGPLKGTWRSTSRVLQHFGQGNLVSTRRVER